MATDLYNFAHENGKTHQAVLCSKHYDKVQLKPGWSLHSKVDTKQYCEKCAEEDQIRRRELEPVYFNTTHYKGQELFERLEAAISQDEKLLVYLRNRPNDSFTRDELHKTVMPKAAITSVGRSLNTLMRLGFVTKLDEYRQGDRGVRQHLWKLKL